MWYVVQCHVMKVVQELQGVQDLQELQGPLHRGRLQELQGPPHRGCLSSAMILCIS